MVVAVTRLGSASLVPQSDLDVMEDEEVEGGTVDVVADRPSGVWRPLSVEAEDRGLIGLEGPRGGRDAADDDVPDEGGEEGEGVADLPEEWAGVWKLASADAEERELVLF